MAALFSLSLESIEEVNKLMTNGLDAGGIEPNKILWFYATTND
ncbi:MAG: hypothetical protein ACKVOM_07160 [Ferruginibacter sp.]